MKFPKILKRNPSQAPRKSSEAKPTRTPDAAEQTNESGDGFDPSGEEKASEWDTMTPNDKIMATAISAWWGASLGGAALLAVTALPGLAAAGIGLAGGVAIGHLATRLSKTNQSRSEAAAAKAQRAKEPSSWSNMKMKDKAVAMGLSGWLGASVVGIGLGFFGVLGPVTALAVGAGVGIAAGRGALGLSKDSDPSYSSSSSDDSSGIALTTDGKLGFSMGGGVVLGTDGKIGFGYEL